MHYKGASFMRYQGYNMHYQWPYMHYQGYNMQLLCIIRVQVLCVIKGTICIISGPICIIKGTICVIKGTICVIRLHYAL